MLLEDQSGELADLYRQRDVLMKHWQAIEATKPPDPFGDHSVDYAANPGMFDVHNKLANERSRWFDDPERGGFWPKFIYPLNQQIEKLETDLKKQRRIGSLQSKRGNEHGFDTSEILYHGTDVEFEEFDRSKARTAAHIYTSPDMDTAKGYGSIIYAVYGRQHPQADLTAENSDYGLVRRIHRHGFKRSYSLSMKDLAELIFDGQLYQSQAGSGLQDDVVSTCLEELKYKSVRLSDGIPGGGFSDSVIFGDIDDLQIVERIE
jgi:hypothetical protein